MSTNDRPVAITMAIALGLGVLLCCVSSTVLFYFVGVGPSVAPMPPGGVAVSNTNNPPFSTVEFELVKVKGQADGTWIATVDAFVSHPENLTKFKITEVVARKPDDLKQLQYSKKLTAIKKDDGHYQLAVTIGPVAKGRSDFSFDIRYDIDSEYSSFLSGGGGSSGSSSKTIQAGLKDFDASSSQTPEAKKPKTE